MSEIVDIKFGRSLPPERWMEAAENLEQVFPMIAHRLELLNNDGMGKQDAQDAMLALVALRFVAATLRSAAGSSQYRRRWKAVSRND